MPHALQPRALPLNSLSFLARLLSRKRPPPSCLRPRMPPSCIVGNASSRHCPSASLQLLPRRSPAVRLHVLDVCVARDKCSSTWWCSSGATHVSCGMPAGAHGTPHQHTACVSKRCFTMTFDEHKRASDQGKRATDQPMKFVFNVGHDGY